MEDAGPDDGSSIDDAASGHGTSTPLHETLSGWSFNWWGLLAVVVVAVIAIVAWSWSSGPENDSSTDDVSERPGTAATTAPAQSTENVARSTTPAPTTSTTRPTRTTASPTTTATASERRVIISGEMKPCRFGDNCLVASFTIEGFDDRPSRYACIYDESRSDFAFNNDQVDDACFTADEDDTITIEVADVRSATISEQNLDGT